jgi:predicted nucleic acid-binding protein
MKRVKVFLDADVILDLLTQREPHFAPAAELFLRIQNKELTACSSPVVIANIFYILSKHLGREQAAQSIRKLRMLVKVLSCGERVIDLALASGFADFEDAIQYCTALEHKIGILITRNVQDYKAAVISIMTPLEYIQSA